MLVADPDREAFYLSAPATNRFTIDRSNAAVLDQGFTFYPAGHPWKFDSDEIGDDARAEWHAISATAPQVVVVYEILRPVS